ncbi:MAG: sigma-70 family RNA polymerase sigma factor [Ideonella sp.]|jgi:RNA polymerase sigma factor (TIGR02999 family)|nr:sigma-70 family RNA polymerase sigma factor [Ideonella sp.]MBL0150145.1 sigma-70 family RNA polymerase sigma factor [Ideonella sp.]
MGEITELIHSAGQGDAGAVDRLYRLLYADLRRVAHAKLRRGSGPAPLDTTELVHESYLRLVQLEKLSVNDRSHFMAYAARAMRSVIVDLVREAQADRRGGGQVMVTLDTAVSDAAPDGDDQILAVHEALQALAAIDERMVRVVEMRYFVGLDMDEIAQALHVGKRTVERDWEKARSFLYAALKRG